MSKWRLGKVEWFDKTSGEGYIRDVGDGNSYYVHYSSIISKEPHKNLTCGGKVKFTVISSTVAPRVDLVKEETTRSVAR
jgi:cold shock CspA family protein